MKLDKLIVSCDDSHYQYYWPVMAKVAKKVLRVTPVLIKISDHDSDFYFDGNGLVKNVKSLEGVETRIQTLLIRLFATKWFPDDVCIISDIDMLVLSERYFLGSIKEFDEDSFVIYTSDAYEKNRDENFSLFNEDIYGLCYNAAKGKLFSDVLDISDSFENFVIKIGEFNKEFGLEWYTDEIYLTKKINQYRDQSKIKRLKRGIEKNFHCETRIEKWNFPVYYVNPDLKRDNSKWGDYDIKKLKNDFYFDCHCIRPYGFYEKEIWDVANVVLNESKIIETIDGQDYSRVNDRCFVDDGCIVDLGCLHWDWSKIFIGKKRIIGVDPFEEQITHTEMFKGIIGNYNGKTTMVNEGISSHVFNDNQGEEVEVKTWKRFKEDFEIDKISILKMNIEGAEYEILKSLDDSDFEQIDQIAISFHDWMNPNWKTDTEFCLMLLKTKGFEITKINDSWGWYLAQKKIEKTNHMKDLIMVSAFCDKPEKQETLRNLVSQIDNHKDKFDLMVISHSIIPQDISEKCEFAIYDKKNELLYDWDMRSTPWFNPNNERAIMSIFTGFFNTHLAIWRMMILGNSIAKNCGYEKLHHLEYDCDIKDFSELYDNSKLLDSNDVVTYTKTQKTVDNILFGTYQAYRLDTLDVNFLQLNEEKLKNTIKLHASKSPEEMLFDILHTNKKGVIKNKSELESKGNKFGLSHNKISFDHTAWCLPYFDELTEKLGFIIWNIEERNEPITVKIIYNDDQVINFGEIPPLHWRLLDVDDYSNAKKLIVILNDKIRNIFEFDQYRDKFKKRSFRQNFKK